METDKRDICMVLAKHFLSLRNYLKVDEIEKIYELAEDIIYRYAYEELEYVSMIKDKTHKFEKLIFKEGKENHIKFTEDEVKAIDDNDALTLSLVHNHPNSTAPSHDDFAVLIIRGSIRNMVVFGSVGNLYFIQKTDSELHFQYSTQDKIDALRAKLRESLQIILLDFLETAYPGVEPKLSWEKIRFNEEKKTEMNLAVVREYFLRSCAEYAFNCYPGS